MSEELDALASSMFNNMVPNSFSKVGPLSLKPLASWINDLNDRINFISKWIKAATPPLIHLAYSSLLGSSIYMTKFVE